MLPLLLLYLVSGIVGALCDQIHVQSGVLAYPIAFYPGGQSVWVPFLFGGAGVVLVKGEALFRRLIGGESSALPVGSIPLTAAGFVLAYLSTGFFHSNPLLLLAGLVVAWLAHFWRYFDKNLIPYCIAVAIGGCLFEGTLASTGAFYYTKPDIYYVPIWLFGLYLHAALLTRAIARRYFA